MADNLESYFKKHLSDETSGKENWNVPSDDVWNKVLPEIQKKKGFFIPWKYFYIIGLLFLVAIVTTFWFVTTQNSPNDNKSTPNILPGTQKVQDAKSNHQININNQITETDKDNPEIPNEKNQNSEIKESVDKQSDNFKLVNNKTILKEDLDQNQIVFEKEEAINIEYPTAVTSKPEIGVLHYIPIFQLSIRNNEPTMTEIPLENNESDIPLFFDDNIKSDKEAYNNTGKFGIGAFFVPAFNNTYLSGNLTKGVIETSNMYLYSNNWGFELKYFISKRFTLLIGVEKSENKSWSKSIINFDYNSSTEHLMPSGEKENTSPVPMQTPFGEIDTEITYRFPGDQEIPNGELMYSATETHQELRYLSIPLGIEYNMIPFSQFNWFTEGGIRYNHAIEDANEFSSRILHEGHDMDVVGEEMMSHPTYTENYLNYYIGTGLNYQVSKSFQLTGSARYFNSITKVNLQDNLSTYVRGFSLKIGILYIY